ncbi:MAG: S8 family serine peptidase [Thermoplasmatota archaeon]
MAFAGNASMTGTDAQVYSLASHGSYADRIKADDAFWSSAKANKLYAFRGTRLLAISMPGAAATPAPAILDPTGHGTEVASIIANIDSKATVVMVQVKTSFCLGEERTDCEIDPSNAEAMNWVANQSWIDIVTTSSNLLAAAPDSAAVHKEAQSYLEASRKAAGAGKIVLNSGADLPTPSVLSYFSGPPWVISVGGGAESQHGQTWDAATTMDVAANFSQRDAKPDTIDSYQWDQGTSFATPAVAGTLAEAVTLIRTGQTPPFQTKGVDINVSLRNALREAMNRTAIQFSAAEWNPTVIDGGNYSNTTDQASYAIGSETVPSAVPGPQMGWGLIDPALAPKIAQFAVRGDVGQPPVSAQSSFMANYQALRIAQWGD